MTSVKIYGTSDKYSAVIQMLFVGKDLANGTMILPHSHSPSVKRVAGIECGSDDVGKVRETLINRISKINLLF